MLSNNKNNNNNNKKILYHQPIESCDPGRPKRKWLDV
jgi:hypothetical protein